MKFADLLIALGLHKPVKYKPVTPLPEKSLLDNLPKPIDPVKLGWAADAGEFSLTLHDKVAKDLKLYEDWAASSKAYAQAQTAVMQKHNEITACYCDLCVSKMAAVDPVWKMLQKVIVEYKKMYYGAAPSAEYIEDFLDQHGGSTQATPKCIICKHTQHQKFFDPAGAVVWQCLTCDCHNPMPYKGHDSGNVGPQLSANFSNKNWSDQWKSQYYGNWEDSIAKSMTAKQFDELAKKYQALMMDADTNKTTLAEVEKALAKWTNLGI